MADKNKIVRVVLLIIGIILLIVLFSWQKSSTNPALNLEKSPNIPANLIGGLTPEQEKEVATFKEGVFSRIATGVPFSIKEKNNIASAMYDQNTIYQFSDEQIIEIKKSF